MSKTTEAIFAVVATVAFTFITVYALIMGAPL